jgi:predicted ATPase
MQSGSGEEGLAELRSCVGRYAATSWTMLGLFHAILAEAELLSGNFEQAEEALAGTKEVGNRWWWAEFLRLRGDLQRSRSVRDRAAAEQSYREAIAAAQGRQAKALELRAATGLVRLWRDEGRPDEARDLLAPVYGWFTEGLDTPDLVEAKALLASLA